MPLQKVDLEEYLKQDLLKFILMQILPVSASSSVFNLDHFLIRRYVDDAAQNVITGFRPPGSEGPYLIKPEFVVPELNKNIDEVILDLTQKGLIT
jgi:hypothetical protein